MFKMNGKGKKILSASLAIAMLFTSVNFTAMPVLAAEPEMCGACGMEYTYLAEDNVITCTCDGGCGFGATATLQFAENAETGYTGSEVKPLVVEYSENWVGSKDAVIVYENNIEIGTATGSVTIGGATATYNFEIPKGINQITFTNVIDKVYDGTPVIAATFTATIQDGAVVEYVNQDDDSSYSTELPTKAGSYFARVTIPGNDKYNEGRAVMEFKISKAPVSITNAAVEESKVYDGDTETKVTAFGELNGVIGEDEVQIEKSYVYAAYADKNVGVDKVVKFYGFDITGPDAKNYELVKQPESVKASITAKEAVVNVKITDKQYDGTTNYDYEAIAKGLVSGDDVSLSKPKASLTQSDVAENIPVTFEEEFALNGADASNYSLKQPEAFSVNICNDFKPKAGVHYTVNTNDWTNKDFVIKAAENHQLSMNNTADGPWVSEITRSVETLSDSSVKFYVKNVESGIISLMAEESYHIDKTAPEKFDILFNSKTVKTEFDKVTFDTFVGGDIKVKITASDKLSGVKSVYYHVSDKVLTEDEVKNLTNWKSGSEFTIEAKDTKTSTVYVKVVDNAGNEVYFASNGVTFDTTAPSITGIENGMTYYVSQNINVDDTNFVVFKVNGVEQDKKSFRLNGDENKDYEFYVEDKAGNKTVVKVSMKTISSISDPISSLTVSNVKSSNKSAINKALSTVLDIDVADATDSEKQKLESIKAVCNTLLAKIDETRNEIDRIDTAIDSYSLSSVKSTDTADINQLIADIKVLTDADNITNDERIHLQNQDNVCDTLIGKINAVQEEINRLNTVVGSYHIDSVTSSDVSAINTLISNIKTLTDGDNLISSERDNLKELDEECDSFLARIEAVKAQIESLNTKVSAYDIDTVTSLDKSALQSLSSELKTLLAGKNLNKTERKTVEGIYATCNSVLGRVLHVESEIKRIDNAVNSYNSGNLKSGHRDDILDLIESIEALTDGENIIDSEREKLLGLDKLCDKHLERIAEIVEYYGSLKAKVAVYDAKTVNSSLIGNIKELVKELQAALDTDNYTLQERKELKGFVDFCNSLIKKVNDILGLLDKDVVKKVEKINCNNAELNDRKALVAAKEFLEDMLDAHSGNLTEDEIKAIEYDIVRLEKSITAIDNAEAVSEAIKALPDTDKLTAEDKDAVYEVKDAYDNLTRHEKELVDQKMVTRLNGIVKRMDDILIHGAAEGIAEENETNSADYLWVIPVLAVAALAFFGFSKFKKTTKPESKEKTKTKTEE